MAKRSAQRIIDERLKRQRRDGYREANAKALQKAAQKAEEIIEEVQFTPYRASATTVQFTPSSASASSHHPVPVQSNLAEQVKNAKDKLAKGALGIVSLTGSQRKDLLQKVEFGKDHAEVNEQWKKDQMVNLFRSDKTCSKGYWATHENVYEKSESTTERRLNGYGTKLLGNI